ncbi:MAG: 50S ribosomal protein L10 [Candidatus Shikimatogenerans sp. JK-2022]|nr:50S ribosomal protein L10 [Candidatus Shikimatogenerans bostrichidophilus]
MNLIKKKKILKLINSYFKKYEYIYFIDISRFKSDILFKFRKDCYLNKIILKKIKNTLLKKVINKKLHKILINNTFLMFSKNINKPTEIINKNNIIINNINYPILKGASIDNEIYIGENIITILSNLKSKDEIIYKIIFLLKNYFYNFFLNYKINSSKKLFNIINILKNKKTNYEKN